MKILFVHQNYMGQYRMILDWLIQEGEHEIVFLTQRKGLQPRPGLTLRIYEVPHKVAGDAFVLSKYYEECMAAGLAVAIACRALEADGFVPDIILGHVGWGELTFTKEVWPKVPVLGYFEYYFLSTGGSVGFDPEFPSNDSTRFIMHARNGVNYINLETVDLGQTPTRWQMNTYPESFHPKLYCCHDGVRTERLRADPAVRVPLGRLGREVTREDEIFTYIARNMEPVRGFHTFMRSLPKILRERPNARVIIIGGNATSYGSKSAREGGYRAEMEAEIGQEVDWSRVHFVGLVPYEDYCRIIQVSRCHIYLTVPFVLSWSLMEAMAMAATLVASDTAPVREVIEHGRNGLLVDFFSPEALADQVIEVLKAPKDFAHLGQAARADVVEHYDFETRTRPVHLERINSLLPSDKKI